MTIEQKAEIFEKQFQQKTRDNGKSFYCLIDNPDSDLYDLVYDAHEDMLPDDYKYQFIYEAISGISEGYDITSIISADDYTSDLTEWLNSSNSRVYYLTQALEDYQPTDGFNLLQVAQEIEKEEVYNSVLASLENLI